MYRSSDSVQVATATPLLHAVLVVVLIAAAVAGILVVAGSQMGWAALGFSIVAGPVAVLAEGRSRTRARAAANPETDPGAPAQADADPRQPGAHWQLA